MKYMGSKNRYAKELLQIILKDRQPGQWYVEPFVGGFNMIDKVDGNRIGADNHYYLIELFKKVRDGWIPPTEITNTDYNQIQHNRHLYPAELVGFVGFGCSYSGKWFGGYARGNDAKGNPRNYAAESSRNLVQQAKNLKGIDIRWKDYYDLVIPAESIIYCDPPYANTTKYASKFDHKEFWQWVRAREIEGHKIFVSEYDAPKDFHPVWQKKVNNSLTANTGSKQGIEKLFVRATSR